MGDEKPTPEELDQMIEDSKTEKYEEAEKTKGHVLDQLQARIKDPKNKRGF